MSSGNYRRIDKYRRGWSLERMDTLIQREMPDSEHRQHLREGIAEFRMLLAMREWNWRVDPPASRRDKVG